MLVLAIVAVFSDGCVGCASSTLPPSLSETEKARVDTARLPFSVGVETYKYPAYSDGLVKALRNTGIFVRVDHLERFSSPPSLVARVEREIYGSPVIPFATLLSFGLIPTTIEERFGYSFSLSRSESEAQRVPIEYSYEARTTLGWVAMFHGLAPGYSVFFPFDPENSRRFRGRLALAILDHTGEIGK
jgi:hypothetical protein